MDTITINKKSYINFDNIEKSKYAFLKGIRNGRELIKAKKLNDKNYIFAKYNKKNNQWVKSDGNSKRFDKVFLEESYFNDNCCVDEIEDVPEIIKLNKKEIFQDDNYWYEIETRGERVVNGIYFRCNDVSGVFKLPNLNKLIKDQRSNYNIDIDYVYFHLENRGNPETKAKEIFLTYQGLLKVLFLSRVGIAHKFISWATETLFTIHLGTETQKNKLASKIIGVNYNVLKEVLNKTSTKMSCIYLIKIGIVKDLRKSMKISEDYDDKDTVYKYGMSIDLTRRLKEHEKEYGDYKGSDLSIQLYDYIDPQYISNAEKSLKSFFEATDMEFIFKKYNELVIIPNDKLKNVKKIFRDVSKMYMSSITELLLKLEKKDDEIKMIKMSYENEIIKKDYELLKKDLIIQQQLAEINELRYKINQCN